MSQVLTRAQKQSALLRHLRDARNNCAKASVLVADSRDAICKAITLLRGAEALAHAAGALSQEIGEGGAEIAAKATKAGHNAAQERIMLEVFLSDSFSKVHENAELTWLEEAFYNAEQLCCGRE